MYFPSGAIKLAMAWDNVAATNLSISSHFHMTYRHTLKVVQFTQVILSTFIHLSTNLPGENTLFPTSLSFSGGKLKNSMTYCLKSDVAILKSANRIHHTYFELVAPSGCTVRPRITENYPIIPDLKIIRNRPASLSPPTPKTSLSTSAFWLLTHHL